MPAPNMKCKVCGKEYYLCQMGAAKYPWKQIVCSEECLDIWNKNLAASEDKQPEKAVDVREEQTKIKKRIK